MERESQFVKLRSKGFSVGRVDFGPYQFQDGISVRKLDVQEIDRLGASMSITSMDGEALGPAADNVKLRSKLVAAQVETKKMVEEETAKPEKVTFTREQLEAVADAEGISGLREIADPLSIKGRSIQELMDELLAYSAKQ